ncbi:MAG: OmpA family protein [Alphaproteobacteria bacterium]|nr:OmpA family protein [Alphaproteobacteria bacterium]MBL6939600.1 OmpA family protein [Alphaproteobacteria bacterium]MBL7100027.1 OmpA family protein [Alphaproteobacteria bacterium]
MASDGAIVIKKIKKGGHGGHHGGAWKVAYADFVTAMMAFFLLMWLINTTTPEQKRGIADYFAPQSIAETVSGAGGVLGGRVMGEDSAKAGGAASVFQKNAPNSPVTAKPTTQNGQSHGGATSADASGANGSADSHANASVQDGDFAAAAEAIHQAVQDNPDIAVLSKQVMIENAPEGLRIQLVDQDGRPMFQQGTAEPMPYTKTLLAAIARIVDRLPNRVSISGHTDGAAFEGPNGTSNWELSSARANVARTLLTGGGLAQDRIYEVAGKAGSEPLLPEDPNASANRRLSIVLLREAPPAPPGHTL